MLRFIFTATVLMLCCGRAFGAPKAYAVIIGNNAPPTDNQSITELRYADDDAVRYYRFFGRMTDDIQLLTVLDVATQKRYPGVAEKASPPTVKQLKAAVANRRLHPLQRPRRSERER